MTPFVKIMILVALFVLVWYVLSRVRSGGGERRAVTFTPVQELSSGARKEIDRALKRGDEDDARRAYVRATSASADAATAAIAVYRGQR